MSFKQICQYETGGDIKRLKKKSACVLDVLLRHLLHDSLDGLEGRRLSPDQDRVGRHAVALGEI